MVGFDCDGHFRILTIGGSQFSIEGSLGVSVEFISERLKFGSNTNDAFATLQLQMLGAFAEFERKIIRSRQAEGIARARERNAYKGRQATIDRAEIIKLYAELKSVSKVAKAMNICRNSVYRNLEKVA